MELYFLIYFFPLYVIMNELVYECVCLTFSVVPANGMVAFSDAIANTMGEKLVRE